MERKGIGMKGKMLKEVQFVDDEHEKFFLDNIVRCRYEEVYHHALIYCLGISETTRRNIDSIYDFATGCIKTECLCEVVTVLMLHEHIGICYLHILLQSYHTVPLRNQC